ncbi:insulinoma-associated protein 1a [Drosophila innubila]|uniref:insulinoma-associated protein 1a n=1 Tax=Drosophila innubila TaxID=198719 RepID=UPI00148DA2CA|nr:insulinoma-associated protein 1a [Drosophila innubila]
MHSIQLLHNASAGGLPHGLGLLTTVASLPPKYRSRYLNMKTKCEIPLDLSVKPPSPVPMPIPMPMPIPTVPMSSCDVPMATTFAELHSEPAEARTEEHLPQEVAQEVVVITEKPITPPQSPVAVAVAVAVKRSLSEQSESQPAAKLAKSAESLTSQVVDVDATPVKPIKVSDTAPRTAKAATTSAKSTRNKATRKLKFDEETSSPVSGTIIRPLEDITDGSMQYSNGDIDPKYNIVEITEETKAELAAIKNVIGDYVCRLCRIKFDDAFGLARHRCACIVLLEYRCPECGKQFNCPANLASHRRWHKPKKDAAKKENRNTSNQQEQPQSTSKKSSEELAFGCNECGKKFKRAAYLRKHQQTHQEQETETEQEQERQPAATTTTITGSFQTSVYKSNSSSSASSSHSYAGTHEDEGVYVAGAASSSHYDYEADYLSDCSSSTSSAGYGRLQIVEHGLTEEESIAAAALTNLRNCASVIQHTTMAH